MTGAGGLLGGRLAALLQGRFAVTAGVLDSPAPAGLPTLRLDVASPEALERALRGARPQAVLHAATLNVEACERDPDLAERVNVAAAAGLARLCRRLGLRLVALSSDLVFDGSQAPCDEAAPARPLQAYGRSKLAGERALLQEFPAAAVVRSALVLGRGHGPRGTASESVAWALRAGRTARLYSDQYRTPIDAASLAELLAGLLRRGGSGVFHGGGPERLSRIELGRRTAQALGLDTAGLVPVTRAELPQAAPRPADVSLDSGRARRELGWEPGAIDAALRAQRPEPQAS